MKKNKKIYIAGHKGMVGSAIWRALEQNGYTKLLGFKSSELDLKDQLAVSDFFKKHQPEIVIDAAARVGGILANKNYPYHFLMENMLIQNNLIDGALKNDCEKFVFLGSSCIYPKLASQPLKEEYLLTAPLEPSNEWYALAKISGVKACEAIRKQYGRDFISLMPTNLYGPYDNFDLETSHVLPAMIRKFHDAKKKSDQTGVSEPVKLWGSGSPMREFLHVDDMADAVVFAIENAFDENLYNVGSGKDLTVKELAHLIQNITGHEGELIWDSSKPDGTPRKLMDVSKMSNKGWNAKIKLEDGVKDTYQWFLNNIDNIKEVKLK